MEKLPPVGEDAFKDGFLSKRFGQRIIDRANRPWKVVMPPNAGSAKVMESKENIVLDLSLAKMGVPAAFNGNRMHPWQCYITSNKPDDVKLKINEYSCLMKGQSAWSEFSYLTWEDRIVPTNFSNEFTHTTPLDVIYLQVDFNTSSKMTISGGFAPLIESPERWGGFPNYQTEQGNYITFGSVDFKWRQLLAYWELTTGDMVPDAIFDGTQYTLRCPTTTHLKESVARGFYDGDGTNMVDYCCLEPWFGCILGSG